MKLIDKLKFHGRKYVLPVSDMKNTMRPIFMGRNINAVVDFGAGTLFWSEWFAKELNLPVIAVDTRYANASALPNVTSNLISLQHDIHVALKQLRKGDNRPVLKPAFGVARENFSLCEEARAVHCTAQKNVIQCRKCN